MEVEDTVVDGVKWVTRAVLVLGRSLNLNTLPSETGRTLKARISPL